MRKNYLLLTTVIFVLTLQFFTGATNAQNLTPSLPVTAPITGLPISGDINRDGIVNLQDYVLLSNAFGTNNSSADINSDGIVNLQDYVILSNNFGRTS